MIANWGYVFQDLDGVDFERPRMRNGVVVADKAGMPQLEKVTLGMVCIDALLGTLKGDDGHTVKDKMRRADLATELHKIKDQETEIALSPEDVKELKERINLCGWHTLIVTKACRILDAGAEQSKH